MIYIPLTVGMVKYYGTVVGLMCQLRYSGLHSLLRLFPFTPLASLPLDFKIKYAQAPVLVQTGRHSLGAGIPAWALYYHKNPHNASTA